MCRDVDMTKLEGVIFDHACGLDAYILNREPRKFQFLCCLVDGRNWQGQKKTSKGQTSLAKEATSGVQKALTLTFIRFVHVFYYVEFLKQFLYILEISARSIKQPRTRADSF